MPSDTLSRTLVLSVVAVDLVGYSRKSVAEQLSLKEHFNRVLLEAIGYISIGDRIILDTGDGVAIGFLGDPEDALYVAMFMHDAINRDSAGSPSGGMDGNAIRIGINLGPVKLATGAGGHPNIIGDGINVAERIMQFAEPGQLTASRPLVEVMTRMSDHYATLFQFAGVRTDKQVRAHDVYVVGRSAAAFRQAQRGVWARAGKQDDEEPGAGYSSTPAFPARTTVSATARAGTSAPHAAPTPERAPVPAAAEPASRGNALADYLEDRNKVSTTAFLLAVIAVTLAALLIYRKMALPKTETPAIAATAPPVAAVEKPASSPAESPPVAAPAVAAPSAISSPIAALDKTVAQKSAAPASTNPPTPAPVGAAPVSDARASTKAASNLPPAKDSTPAKPSQPPATTLSPVATPPAKDTKAVDRPAPRPEPASAPSGTRDRARDALAEPPAVRDSTRKPSPSKPVEQRILPGASPPIVPAYQSPAEAPKQEAVAPTPAPPVVVPALDTNVVIVSRAAPDFPIEAVRQGITSGTVRARATIDARGNVAGEVTILEARPLQAFGREARQSIKNWKFNPGAPGRVYEVEISFKQ